MESDGRNKPRSRRRLQASRPSTRAAVLGLGPVRDREDYAALGELRRLQKDGEPLISDIEQLAIPTSRVLGRWAYGR